MQLCVMFPYAVSLAVEVYSSVSSDQPALLCACALLSELLKL